MCGEVARSTGQWKPQDRSVPGCDKCQLPRAAGVCVGGQWGAGWEVEMRTGRHHQPLD